jgi:ribosome-binding ATPase
LPDDVIKPLFLLTSKPILYVGNVGEQNVQKELVNAIELYAKKQHAEAMTLSVKVESEIAQLPENEREIFRQEMGIEETGLQKLIRKSFSLLNVITFFTVGADEVKAWTIPAGTFAPQAAGKIHSDIEKGFIKAEVYAYNELIAHGSETALREKGLIRMEGKTYPMKDGDVVFFRFAV